MLKDLSLTIPVFTKRKTNSDAIIYNLVLIVGILAISLSYLFLINSQATKGYSIRKLELQLRSIEAEQKALQLKASDLQSVNRIQTQARLLNFVPVTSITYLKDTDYAFK